MGTFTDQLGYEITLARPPKRIVSLVPSQTELLAYLGLEDNVVGITKFCVHPADWKKTKRIIGGTKNINMGTIRQLQPDLIIGNKEENLLEDVEQLKAICPVWMSDISTLSNAYMMISQIGELTATQGKAAALIDQLKMNFSTLKTLPSHHALYLIWYNPWMAAASNTFIHEMIRVSGLNNCLSDEIRYPELTIERIKELRPAVVMLSSEPYPFKQKHIDELKSHLPESKVLFVDGEIFSWYGSRLLQFPEYLNSLRSQLL